MRCQSTVVVRIRTVLLSIACLAALLACACREPRKAPQAQQQSYKASEQQPASVVKNTREDKDGLGTVVLADGSKFKTSLYGLESIGQLRTDSKLPYLILSGTGCTECDANTSIYIHSPSDGPMQDEGREPRYSYPGKEYDYQRDSVLVYEARMFYGDCLASHPNAVVWFYRNLTEDKKWHQGVQVAEVKADRLMTDDLVGSLPALSESEKAVQAGRCRELPGINKYSEP